LRDPVNHSSTDPTACNFKHRRAQAIDCITAHQSISTMYGGREAPADGGLMSYGISFQDAYRQAAAYVSRVLKGEKPVDLPVLRPTKFDLVINLATAKQLGLTIRQACSPLPTR
jgi:putative tryptophan/tyrosine transport system substrate-binding protein